MSGQKSLGKRLRDRFLRKPATEFQNDLDSEERPLLMRMDVVNRCNLRCFMCPYLHVFRSGEPAEMMTPLLFERIAEQVFRHVYHLSLSCAYEPLMHPKITEILKIASRYHPPEWGMVTNGSLLNTGVADAMIDSGLTSVSISLDAASPEIYKAVRGVDVFERVVENVRALQRRKRERESELPHVLSNFVLMRRNLDEVLPYLELCVRFRAEDVTFVHVIPRSTDNEESLINDPGRYEKVYAEARKFAEEKGLRIVLPAPFTEDELAGRANRRLQESRSDDLKSGGVKTTSVPVESVGDAIYCAAPWIMVFVTPNGDVHPCSHRKHDPPFGNLKQQTFEEIWNSPPYLELRRQLYYHDLEGRCTVCEAATPNSEPMVRRPIRLF